MSQDNSTDSPKNGPPKNGKSPESTVSSYSAQNIAGWRTSKLDPALLDRNLLESGLYVTATPIGNLRDITLRALDALGGADLILCEDTRVTKKLLNAFGLMTPMRAYHDHNAAKIRPQILKKLAEGGRICLVSDAGTPLISDPGYQLVRAAHEGGLPVTTLPGASAPIAALTLSGLPSDRFVFLGFLPPKKGARAKVLHEAQGGGTMILFESARRLVATLGDLQEIFGDCEGAIARELTKKFEEVRRGPLSTLSTYYQDNPPKGEIVILLSPGDALIEVDVEAQLQLALQTLSTKDAAAQVAALAGVPRKQVYDLALRLKKAEGL